MYIYSKNELDKIHSDFVLQETIDVYRLWWYNYLSDELIIVKTKKKFFCSFPLNENREKERERDECEWQRKKWKTTSKTIDQCDDNLLTN